MRKFLWIIIILNFILLIPRFKANFPILRRNLSGDLRVENHQDLNDLLEAFDWLKTQKGNGAIRHDAVVVCRKPQHCYYYVGLKSISFPFTGIKDSVFTAITKADLIVAQNLRATSTAFLNPVLMDSAKYFRPIYMSEGKVPNVVIFAVKKDELAKLYEQKL